jgi:hypothetical protein
MKTNAIRFAAGLALLAGAPFPAFGQFSYPPVLIVPPPPQSYVPAKPAPKPPPDRSKVTDAPPAQAKPGGHYEGRTWVPD